MAEIYPKRNRWTISRSFLARTEMTEPTEQQREAADDSAGVLRDRAEGKWKMKTLGPMDERRAIRLEVRRFGRYGEQRLISVGSAAAVKISDM